MIPEAIFILASFTTPEASLEPFSLQSVAVGQAVAEAQALVDDVKRLSKPSLAWRMLGWGEIISCAAIAPSYIEYRRSRSGWEPAVGNTFANYAMWSGVAVGSNYGTAAIHHNGTTKTAWAARIGTLALCTWTAAYNGHKGWHHE